QQEMLDNLQTTALLIISSLRRLIEPVAATEQYGVATRGDGFTRVYLLLNLSAVNEESVDILNTFGGLVLFT
ncbi:hypothetical protein ACJX0J_031104, partial [Zea mays]